MKPSKLILFDYDGVLVDSLDFNLQVVSKIVTELGYDRHPTVEYCRSAPSISFEEFARSIEMDPSHIPQFVERIHEQLIERKTPLALFENISELLTELAKTHQLGVVTANTSTAASDLLSEHGILECFSHVVGADEPGSKADKITQISHAAGYPVKGVYYVGDAGSDIKQGKLAGTITVGVTWGYQSRERLQRENPDFIVNSVKELADIFNS